MCRLCWCHERQQKGRAGNVSREVLRKQPLQHARNYACPCSQARHACRAECRKPGVNQSPQEAFERTLHQVGCRFRPVDSTVNYSGRTMVQLAKSYCKHVSVGVNFSGHWSAHSVLVRSHPFNSRFGTFRRNLAPVLASTAWTGHNERHIKTLIHDARAASLPDRRYAT